MPGALLVFNISRQWGKTYFGVCTALEEALKNPGSRIRIGAAFESDLTEFIEPAFEQALKTCPEHLQPKYNQQKKRFVFPNGPNALRPFIGGSTIKLVGLDKKPNGLRGNTIDLIILDEAGFISRLNYLYDSVIVPLTTHRPNARVLLLSTPPESPDHEFWDFVDKAKLDGTYAEFTIDQNPMLNHDDVARLEKKLGGRETSAFQREYLCKRVVETERAIIPEWKSEMALDFDPTEDPLYVFWHKYEALDIGVQVDKTICLFAYYNFEQSRLYIIDEVDVSGSLTTTDRIESKILDKEKEWLWGLSHPLYRRVSDNTHPLLINDLSQRAGGLVFLQTDKEKLHEMVGKVRVWVRQDRLRVHTRCKQMLGCITSGIWNKTRTEFERSKVFGHYDALAALVYLIRNTDEWTNPIPDYVRNPGGWPIAKPAAKLSPLGEGLKGIFSQLK